MKTRAILLASAVLVATLATGCKPSSTWKGTDRGWGICGQCGYVKGTAECCKPGATLCEKCKLVKGSPGCCVIVKGENVPLCNKCGHILNAKDCCKPNAERCPKCKLIKGSPGCCKLP